LRDTFFGKIKERLISMKVVNKHAEVAKGQMISEGNKMHIISQFWGYLT
jgi:hypothetical protein